MSAFPPGAQLQRIYLYEELTAFGPFLDPALFPLIPEGLALSQALTHDLSLLDWVTPTVLVQADFASRFQNNNQVQIRRTSERELANPFQFLESPGDKVLVIAPENGGVLETRVAQATQAGLVAVNCGTPSLRIASDKWQTFLHWEKNRVPTPATWLLNSVDASALKYPLIMKPRDGAGCCDTFFLTNAAEFSRCKILCGEKGFMAQNYCPGMAASAAFIAKRGQIIPLIAGQQNISIQSQIEYQGGKIPLPEELHQRAMAIGGKALEGLEELHGWIGVDLVLGNSPDGKEDMAIEINPRFTTSYLGIRELISGKQLMELLLGNSPLPFPDKKEKLVSFQKNGVIIPATP
ncbi:MAG: ATP-grasp domain-containing protein [Gemmataceae bacterium]|nr:ATP-grasp domain-containing protein [Gemmataceae bacterium]